jgi:hypothetical protein
MRKPNSLLHVSPTPTLAAWPLAASVHAMVVENNFTQYRSWRGDRQSDVSGSWSDAVVSADGEPVGSSPSLRGPETACDAKANFRPLHRETHTFERPPSRVTARQLTASGLSSYPRVGRRRQAFLLWHSAHRRGGPTGISQRSGACADADCPGRRCTVLRTVMCATEIREFQDGVSAAQRIAFVQFLARLNEC